MHQQFLNTSNALSNIYDIDFSDSEHSLLGDEQGYDTYCEVDSFDEDSDVDTLPTIRFEFLLFEHRNSSGTTLYSIKPWTDFDAITHCVTAASNDPLNNVIIKSLPDGTSEVCREKLDELLSTSEYDYSVEKQGSRIYLTCTLHNTNITVVYENNAYAQFAGEQIEPLDGAIKELNLEQHFVYKRNPLFRYNHLFKRLISDVEWGDYRYYGVVPGYRYEDQKFRLVDKVESQKRSIREKLTECGDSIDSLYCNVADEAKLSLIKEHFNTMDEYFHSFSTGDKKFKDAFRRHYGMSIRAFRKLSISTQRFIITCRDLSWLSQDITSILRLWAKQDSREREAKRKEVSLEW